MWVRIGLYCVRSDITKTSATRHWSQYQMAMSPSWAAILIAIYKRSWLSLSVWRPRDSWKWAISWKCRYLSIVKLILRSFWLIIRVILKSIEIWSAVCSNLTYICGRRVRSISSWRRSGEMGLLLVHLSVVWAEACFKTGLFSIRISNASKLWLSVLCL